MLDAPLERPRTPPRPRSPGVDLDGSIPRHWLANNVWATHVANGVNLLFPAGERFFVRAVRHYLPKVEDPVLREHVKGFFGQEGRHAKEHERFFEVLEQQGYDVQRFLRVYEAIAYGLIEKIAPPSLRLASTAACEHFTAILAEEALRGRLLDFAHPSLRKLLWWHAAEEIEHRAVAFDVLRAVAPGYGLRMAGLAMATVCLAGFWIAATSSLLVQERSLGRTRLKKDAAIARAWPGTRDRDVFARGIREYMRRDFHPSQSDIDGLASAYLASVGLS